MAVIATDPIWVDEQTQLETLCAQWQQQAAIAIDTEFMRSHTFYPHAGLIQVGDGSGCYLIDPLAIKDLSALAALMSHEGTVKVIHSCSEDLEVFRHLLGVVPSPLFDTQIAAAYAGIGFSMGYAALVNNLLSIELEKGETRSDWMQRPLSQSQLHYAALDVAYLLIVYGKILQELKARQRLSWVQEECALLISNAQSSDVFADAYNKIKLAWKLYPDQLAVLREVCVWREQAARALDVPRNRLLKENAAWEIARRKPKTVKQLLAIDGVGPRTQKVLAEELLAVIAKGEDTAEERWPERLPLPLTPAQGEVQKALKKLALAIAARDDIASEVILRKKDLDVLVRSVLAGSVETPAGLKGWRYDVVGKDLEKLAQELIDSGAQYQQAATE